MQARRAGRWCSPLRPLLLHLEPTVVGSSRGVASTHAPALAPHAAVVEQMARHMRSRGLQQTLGTASALLTAQALQHGHVAAKWLLQPPGMGAAGSSSSAAAPLPDDAVESCLLGRGSPQACMQKLLHSGGGASSSSCSGSAAEDAAAAALRPDRTVANVVLAGLAVRGCTTEAVQLFDWMKQQPAAPEPAAAAAATGSRARRRPAPVCSPDAWTCQLLLYAALNAPKEHQLELTLRAVKEARCGVLMLPALVRWALALLFSGWLAPMIDSSTMPMHADTTLLGTLQGACGSRRRQEAQQRRRREEQRRCGRHGLGPAHAQRHPCSHAAVWPGAAAAGGGGGWCGRGARGAAAAAEGDDAVAGGSASCRRPWFIGLCCS